MVLPSDQPQRNKLIATIATERRDTGFSVTSDDDSEAERYSRQVITSAWRANVEAAMRERGWNRSELADALRNHLGARKLHRAVITKLLDDSTGSMSKYVEPLSALLGIPLPIFRDALEESYVEDMRMVRESDRTEFERLLGLVRTAAIKAARKARGS